MQLYYSRFPIRYLVAQLIIPVVLGLFAATSVRTEILFLKILLDIRSARLQDIP